eukprot:Seg332.5 transcript_id=Seg332.5/GoldUCD/mRNA.D3Y31 product="hypothetical protein" protein_id=Seg332.5/GoldUCD/D3Y31
MTTADSIINKKLEEAIAELQGRTPPPLCADFEKETRDDAIKKRNERMSMSQLEVPPTCAVAEPVPVDVEDSRPQKTRCCTLCKKPMKGHKEVLDCPRNQKN